MGLSSFIVTAVVTLGAIEATALNPDQVQPFAQPKPVTASEQAAVKFKPSLSVTGGCHPYPAVNAAGETSNGLKPTGSASSSCEGSELGSQIYGRAEQHDELWAIIYAWYMPKNAPAQREGYRHDWPHIVVWIDDPKVNQPTMKGISVWNRDMNSYDIYNSRLEDYRNGSSLQVMYYAERPGLTYFRVDLGWSASAPSEFQDLIMWEQLNDEARTALEDTDFGNSTVPFKDATFQSNLDDAWPIFKQTTDN